MRCRTGTAILLVAILILPTVTAARQPWWPDQDDDPARYSEGWNLRVPIKLSSPDRALAAGHPVQVHLDLGLVLSEAGWPTVDGLAGPYPISFRLDVDSLRLVEYGDQWSTLRGVVPAAASATWFEPEQQERWGKAQARPFDGTRNPVVTLEWLLPETLEEGKTAHYILYYEIFQNSDKPAVHDPAGEERLDGLYWSGAGKTLFGHKSPDDRIRKDLHVYGLHDDTTVTVYQYSGALAEVHQRPGQANPFTLDRADTVRYALDLAEADFRIEADKPVLALLYQGPPGVGPAGVFAPAADQGHLGEEFLLPFVSPNIVVVSPDHAQGITRFCLREAQDPPCSPGQSVILEPGRYAEIRAFTNPDGPFNDLSTTTLLEVVEGSPVLVQYVSDSGQVRGAQQVPSHLGSPVGKTFRAVVALQEDAFYDLTPWDGGLAAQIKAQETFSYPLGDAGEISRVAGITFTPSEGSDQRTPPLNISVSPLDSSDAADAIQVRVSREVGSGSTSLQPQQNPFGGRRGMEFHVHGPSNLMPFYDATTVHVETDSQAPFSVQLDAGIPFRLDTSPESHARISADKPIAVLPLLDRPGYFLAARPDFVEPEILAGQYRGYLVDVEPPGGLDPYFVEGKPGETVRIPFTVQNLALRTGGEPLSDRIDLGARLLGGPAGVGLEFEQIEMQLDDSTPTTAVLEVTLPSTMEAESTATVEVQASSRGNPSMSDGFVASVFAKSSFGVQAWFDIEGGDKQVPVVMEPGANRTLDIVIKNTGGVEDSFSLESQALSGGWNMEVIDEEGDVVQNTGVIPAGQARQGLRLSIQAPEAIERTSVNAVLDVISDGSPLEADRLLARARLSLGQDLDISVQDALKDVPPGGTGRFVATVTNTGEDSLDLSLELLGDAPQGWSVRFERASDAEGVSLLPGQSFQVPVVVSVGSVAPAGQLATFLFQVQDQRQGGPSGGAAMTVAVADSGALQVEDPAVVETEPGSTKTIEVQVSNTGNGPRVLHLRPSSLPGGWDFESNASLQLEPGESGVLRANLTLPGGTVAGDHMVRLRVVMDDGRSVDVPATVSVSATHALRWQEPSSVQMQPGQTVVRGLRLENEGNVPVSAMLSLKLPTGWSGEVSPKSVDIPHLRDRPVAVSWSVPDNTPSGSYSLELRAQEPQSGISETIEIPVTVADPALVLDDARLLGGEPEQGAVRFVQAFLSNPGPLTVQGVRVDLLNRNGEPLDTARIDALGAGEQAEVVLVWSVEDPSEAPELRWGLEAGGGFQGFGSKSLSGVPIDSADRDAPAIALVLVLLCLGAVAAATRRRRT